MRDKTTPISEMNPPPFNFDVWFGEVTRPLHERLEAATRKITEGVEAAQSKSNEKPSAYRAWADSNGWLTVKENNDPKLNTYPKGVRVGTATHRDKSLVGGSIEVPVCIPLLQRKGLVIHDEGTGSGTKIMSSLVLRLLLSSPACSFHVHLIDAMTMGRAFSALGHIDQTLATLCDTTELGINDLLRTLESRITDVNRRCLVKANSLIEFNEQHAEQREVMHIICAANFPQGFSPEAQASLNRMLSHENGSRAGVYFLATSDGPFDAQFADLPTIKIPKAGKPSMTDGQWLDVLGDRPDALFEFKPELDQPREITGVVDYINTQARSGQTKKVRISVDESSIWKSSTHKGITVPVGRTAGQIVNFTLGNEAVVHNALIGGAVGTGKTVLLHNIIANAALTYSPEELQMVLLDYKEGTEFAVYRNLPHVRILSIASEIDFGLKVFEWLAHEKARRATEFKKTGAAKLEDYRRASGSTMPRILVIIDEFQRLLVNPLVGFRVAGLLDDIARTGRSFGLNLVLSTQSLANVQIEASTLANIGLRVCLRMSEAEASRFLHYDNMAPSHFTQAGQAVYNDAEGRRESNTEFQVGYLDTAELEGVCSTLQKREKALFGKEIVSDRVRFSGDMPASMDSIPNHDRVDGLSAWVGAALAIHAPAVKLHLPEVDGGNVIIVAGNSECLRTLCFNTAKQFMNSKRNARIWVLDTLPNNQDVWNPLTSASLSLIASTLEGQDVIAKWQEELQRRADAVEQLDCEAWLLYLIEAHASRLFPSNAGGDPSENATTLQKLLQEGPRHSMHLIVCGTRLARMEKALGNYGRLDLQAFGSRIAMKSEDGATLFDGLQTLELGPYTGYLRDEQSLDGHTAFQLFEQMT